MKSRVNLTKILLKSFENCNFQRIFKGIYSDFIFFSCLWPIVFDYLFCVNQARNKIGKDLSSFENCNFERISKDFNQISSSFPSLG